MKKIFYILASAIVALGAVACENEGLDNVNPENTVKGEGLTITATIDEATKVAFDGLTPSWEVDKDKLVIDGFEFLYKGENQFTCEADGVYAVVCNGKVKEITAGEFNSSNGLAGSAWAAESVIDREGTEVELKLVTAVLKVTAAADNTVLKSVMFSNEEDVALTKGVETYVPIWRGDNTTVTYFVDGIECKSLTKNFEGGKIYNLGTLDAPVILRPNSNWTQANAWFVAYFCNGTSAAEAVKMTKSGDYYIAFVPKGDFKNVVFCRMDPAKTEHNWEDGSVWGQTQDMTISKGDRCGIIGWNTGMWKSEHKTTELYLLPNDDWKQANARFAAYFYGNGEKWISMTKHGVDVYKVTIPTGYPSIIFCRMNPGNATNNWDNKWNQTAGNNAVKVSGNGGKVYEITGWDNSGKWVEIKF